MSYLIHSSILLAAFVGFYWLLLRKETFYKLNRWIFIFGILLSLCLPLVTVPAYMSFRAPETSEESVIATMEIPPIPFQDETYIDKEIATQPEPKTENTSTGKERALTNLSIGEILQYIYLLGAVIFSIVFLLQLVVLLARRYTLNSVQAGKYQIVELVKEQEPYSFLNSIFINPNSYDRETYEHIFEHEKVHVDQIHFFDKLLAEVLVIVFWFNPFVWMLRNVLSENLEFLTDQSLLQKGLPKQNYQMSLLKVSTSKKPFNLTNSYNNSFLKNRILMMNAKRSTITSSWKYLFILPLFLFSLMSLNAVENGGNQITDLHTQTEIERENENQEARETNTVIQPTAKTNTSINQSLAGTEISLPEITAISTTHNIEVIIQQGSKQSVRLEGPEDLLNKLNKKVEKGFWNIYIPNLKGDVNLEDKKIKVYITVQNLYKVRTSGASKIVGKGQFNSDNDMYISANGSSIIVLDFLAESTTCNLSGASIMKLSGKTNQFDAKVSGSGNMNSPELVTENSKMHVSGAGVVAVTVQKELDANISGAGVLRYKGNPQITKRVSGGGSFGKMK